MYLYAVISLQKNRNNGEVADTVQYISSDLDAARQVYEKVTTADFNFTYWKPLTKYIVKFKDGKWFSDGLINEEEVEHKDFEDVLVTPGYCDTIEESEEESTKKEEKLDYDPYDPYSYILPNNNQNRDEYFD